MTRLLHRIGPAPLLAGGVVLSGAALLPGLPHVVHATLGVLSLGVLLGFYWLHCAGPALYFAGATPVAMRVAGGLGAVTWVTYALIEVWSATQGLAPLAIRLLPALPGLWFCAAWPLPGLVGRLSGGISATESARRRSHLPQGAGPSSRAFPLGD
jgi:hypothetical protein